MLPGGEAASPGIPGLGRDRATLLTGAVLIAVAALAWVAVVVQASTMQQASMPGADPGMASDMGMATSADHSPLSSAGAAAFLVSWGVMMAAMMLPSATPMIALYGAIERNFARS